MYILTDFFHFISFLFLKKRPRVRPIVVFNTLFFLYVQLLRLSQTALSKTTTGQIVNLMTSDVQKLEQVCTKNGVLVCNCSVNT